MAFISSNWRVTFDKSGADEFQLVNYLDELDEVISLPWAQAVDTKKPLRADAATKFPRGRTEFTLTIGVWKTHASHAAAGNYLLAHAAALPLAVSANLRIDVKDGSSYLLSSTVFASGDGRLVVGLGVIRTWVQYKLEGGTFTIV